MTTSIVIDQGLAVVTAFQFHLTNNTFDTTTPAQLTFDPTKVRATINPTNNREMAIVGLQPTGGNPVLVGVRAGGPGAPQSFIQVGVVAPTIDQVILGTPGPEGDPPSWA